MYIDFNHLTANERYHLMVQSIIPRPIAWVLSDSGFVSEDDQPHYNLAPFSFFSGICSDPPIVMFSVGVKPSGDEKGARKDTCVNITERKQFVIHIAHADCIDVLNQSAETLSRNISEVDKLGLELCEFEGFTQPRLKVCRIAMGCELHKMDTIGNTPQAIVYGEIKTMFIDDEIILRDEKERLKIVTKELDPLSRLGGAWYGRVGQELSAQRPK